ncbi:hypothetical protein BJY59DRAFT_723069 [Rhodotorula toruloides]
MAGGRAAPRTSYKEADSDDDWLAGDEEGATKGFEDLPLVEGAKGKAGGAKGRKRVGDTYGAGPRKKARKSKSKGKEKAKEDEDEPLFSLDLLFRLADDLFLEICGYLDGRDLLEFSRTCKAMRKTLFSPNSGYIWANSRRRDDIPLPSGMTELALACLLYGKGCQICGNESFYFRRDCYLRFRSCARCRKTYVIAKSKLARQWPDLHPSAHLCVPFHDEGINEFSGNQQPVWYLVSELAEVHSLLLELEEEDELLRYAASGSMQLSRSSGYGPALSLVDDFVKCKRAEVAQKQKESSALDIAFSMKVSRDREAMDQKRWAKREDVKAVAQGCDSASAQGGPADLFILRYVDELVANHGWTKEQTDWYLERVTWMASEKHKPPTESPADDEEGWGSFGRYIQGILDRHAAAKQSWQVANARREALRPFYQDYCEASSKPPQLLPSLYELGRQPSIKPWLLPASPLCDEALWEERRPVVDSAIDDFQINLRLHAIRLILSATTGVSLADLSSDPADYPESKYDADFFDRPTSLFGGELEIPSMPGVTIYYPLPFPNCLVEHKSDMRHQETMLGGGINERQVIFIRLLLDAAGLDETTTNADDLVYLGARFRWTNHPSQWRSKRETKMYWAQALYAMLSRGPKLAQLKAGDLPEIECVPVAAGDDEKRDSEENDSGEDDDPDSGSNSDADGDSDSEAHSNSGGRSLRSSDGEMEDEEDDEDEEEDEADE